MTDTYKGHYRGLEGPIENIASVTPNDSADLAFVTRAIIVGVAGNVTVDTAGGSSNVAFYAAAGVPIPIRATRIYSTGTAATGIVACW